MVSYIVLTLGGMLFAAMVYRTGGRDREPWWMLAGAAVAGGIFMAVAFGIGDAIQAFLIDAGPQLNLRLTKSLTTPPLQILAKIAVPLAILLLVRKHFDDPMDGLIYGSLAGLGAAFTESIWYSFFAAMPTPPTLVHAHGPNALRFLLHTLWGGIAAFALGRIVMQKPYRRQLIQCLGGVLVLHILWDLFLAFAPNLPENALQRIVMALVLGGTVVWYGLLVVESNKWSRSMHPATGKQKLVGRIIKMLITKRFR